MRSATVRGISCSCLGSANDWCSPSSSSVGRTRATRIRQWPARFPIAYRGGGESRGGFVPDVEFDKTSRTELSTGRAEARMAGENRWLCKYDPRRDQRAVASPTARPQRTGRCGYASGTPSASPARARASSLRELISSLMKTLRRWYLTVRGLMNRRMPMSGFESPSRARCAISAS